MLNSIHSNFNAYARQSTLQVLKSNETNPNQNATQNKEANISQKANSNQTEVNFTQSKNTNLSLSSSRVNPSQDANLKGINSVQNAGVILNQIQTNPTQKANLNVSSGANFVQNSTPNSQSTTSANFALDKNQAVSQILGYGVDNEGYFTSDFNEAAGLPSDYRIYAKGALEVARYLESFSMFYETDFIATLGNAYKLFSQLTDDKASFSQEELTSFPLGFDYDKKSLEVTKIYTDKESLDKQIASSSNTPHYQKSTITSVSFRSDGADYTKKNENIFSLNGIDIGKNAYTNEDNSITKGGALMAFMHSLISQNDNGILIQNNGTTIAGKLMGFDKNLSDTQVDELNTFLANNSFSVHSEGGIEILLQKLDLFSSNLSVEEFKEKWLELDTLGNETLANSTNLLDKVKAKNSNENTEDNEEKDKKAFTPIEAESSRDTYKNLSGIKNLELAKIEQMADMLAILFHQKAGESSRFSNLDFSNATFSNSTFKEVQKFIGSRGGVDLRA